MGLVPLEVRPDGAGLPLPLRTQQEVALSEAKNRPSPDALDPGLLNLQNSEEYISVVYESLSLGLFCYRRLEVLQQMVFLVDCSRLIRDPHRPTPTSYHTQSTN